MHTITGYIMRQRSWSWTQKFRVAKQVRDGEEESERLEGELESLRAELGRMEGEGEEGAPKRTRG